MHVPRLRSEAKKLHATLADWSVVVSSDAFEVARTWQRTFKAVGAQRAKQAFTVTIFTGPVERRGVAVYTTQPRSELMIAALFGNFGCA